MAQHVRQGLLRDAAQLHRGLGRQRRRQHHVLHVPHERDAEPVERRLQPVTQVAQALADAGVGLVVEGVDRQLQLQQAGLQGHRQLAGVGGARVVAGHERHQPRTDAVMQVAGDAAALGEHGLRLAVAHEAAPREIPGGHDHAEHGDVHPLQGPEGRRHLGTQCGDRRGRANHLPYHRRQVQREGEPHPQQHPLARGTRPQPDQEHTPGGDRKPHELVLQEIRRERGRGRAHGWLRCERGAPEARPRAAPGARRNSRPARGCGRAACGRCS
ncbi:hypothetical protein D9M68_677890 [compost metagenome]